jgi:hypothetical protein
MTEWGKIEAKLGGRRKAVPTRATPRGRSELRPYNGSAAATIGALDVEEPVVGVGGAAGLDCGEGVLEFVG